MTDRYPDDAALEAAGYASGMAVWGVLEDVYGDVLGNGHLASAQLESLKRAILAQARGPEPVLGRHEDERGVIQDLLGAVGGVTEITTRAGAVRGNHVHKLTTQWTYVVSGMLRTAWMSDSGDGVHTVIYGPGVMIEESAGIPHAWQAIEDTTVLVFTRGPRSGEAYESDTQRLEVPLLT